MRILALVTALLLAVPAAQAAEPNPVLDAAINAYIRPQTQSFALRTSELVADTQALCDIPSGPALVQAQQGFAALALAYGHVEFLRLGPLMEANRSDRILFWPDRRSIGLKQVQAVLAEEDASATDPATLQAKSVAVQGLGALEFVLFGTGSEALDSAEGNFRCAYAEAIALNLAAMAADIASAWAEPDGIAKRLANPAPGYTDYRTDIEALEALTGLVAHGIEAVRDTRINPFIAQGDAAAKPKQALFWRSDLTMPMIKANLDGLEQLVSLSGLAAAATGPNQGLAASIAFEFRNARRAIDLVTLPVEQAVEDEKQAQALRYLVIVTASLQDQIGEQLSAALALSVGFSSLDGD
jgi:predicted lipoprotein